MGDSITLKKEEAKFLLQHLEKYKKEKNNILKECLREEEQQFWNRFFCVSEMENLFEKLQEAYNNA